MQGDVYQVETARVPPVKLLFRELHTVVEYAVSHYSRSVISHWPKGDGHPVIVLPGFLAGEKSTRFLRQTLSKLGYAAYDWGQGINLGLRPGMEEVGYDMLSRVFEAHGEKVTLIGWSAGGIFARELAREHPEMVRRVITLGSPIRGNPKATRAWKAFKRLSKGPRVREMFDAQAIHQRSQPLEVPTTCVYSKLDGIVAWQLCTTLPAPDSENVEVRCSHLGFGHHLEPLYVIASRLAEDSKA